MAAIQYVGLPEVLPKVVIKCGYKPRVDGGFDWYVEVIDRESGIRRCEMAKGSHSAFKRVEELKKIYGGNYVRPFTRA